MQKKLYVILYKCCVRFSKFFSDGGETQADFSDVFQDGEGEQEQSGEFYNTPASPITVPYCPRPPSTGTTLCNLIIHQINLVFK